LVRSGWNSVFGVIAIYVIALHVVLAGFKPVDAGGAPASPGFVICHSDPAGIPSEHHDGGAPGDDSCCDRCDLCNALATPPLPDSSQAQLVAPTTVLDVLRPLSTTARLSLSRSPKLARGPPSTA
jgi:hypothetical protein